ncbi:hypothetical protein Tsubulata_048566 [Turnera subulata]|uniref:KIB1-4 beta-propeller domain-containing protein n=1 Tax=Turnera subulata TaxID=218843 RepID=A0A9Q0G8X0_9ROSI|nr:hypothetical protein Tsubulata_048566 [Turnera subulata]
MACLSFLVQKVGSTQGSFRAVPSLAWRTVSSAACFSSLSRRGGGGVPPSPPSTSRPTLPRKPVGDHENKVPPLGNEVQEFPLPLSSYPVLMLPDTKNTCRLFSAVTGKFTTFTYPVGEGGKFCCSASFPHSSQHGWMSFFTKNDCSVILANGVFSNKNPSTISLPPFNTIPNLHSLPIPIDDPEAKAWVPPGTDCFFYYTDVRNGIRVKLLPRGLRANLTAGHFVLSSAPTEDDCVVFLHPYFALRRGLGIDFAYCRIGDTRWSTAPLLPPGGDRKKKKKESGYPPIMWYVVYSSRDKLFYVLNPDCCIQLIDFNDPDSAPPKRLCSPEPAAPVVDSHQLGKEFYGDVGPSLECREYLAESPQGDPLLVLRYGVPHEDGRKEHREQRTLGFHVYKLCFNEQRQVVAEEFNLDGTALFVEDGASFTVPVRDYPGLMPNSVYFYGLYEIGFYNLLDRSFTHFYQPFEIIVEECLTSYPFWVSRPQ